MRIGIDARCLQMDAFATRGVGRYAREIVSHLVGSEDENEYVIFGRNLEDVGIVGTRLNNAKIELVQTNPVIEFSKKGLLQQEILFPLEISRQRLDLIHVLFSQNASVLHWPKQVLTVHDLVPLFHPATPRTTIKQRIRLRMIAESAKRANLLIAISQSTKNDLVNILDIPDDRIEVILHGIEGNFKAMEKEKAKKKVREEFNIDGDLLLYVGGFNETKNLASLIEVFARLKREARIPHKLVLVGRMIPKPSFIQILQRISELRLFSDVFLPDFVSDEQLVSFYNASDLFVFPSLYEGFGFPLLEAMACGLPIVAFRNSSIPEVVGDAALLAENNNNDAFFDAVNRLLGEETLRNGLARKGAERAKLFTWEEAARKTILAYKKAVQ